MPLKTDSHYPHRRNKDGSFDSICVICFRTIAHERCEADLLAKEAVHACEPSALTQSVWERHWSGAQAAGIVVGRA